MAILPPERPRLSREELLGKLSPFQIDRARYPLVIVGIRGYYRDSMGAPAVNDRGIYDDALFIDTEHGTVAYNGNTDPSSFRIGQGTGSAKGMASLNPGAWFAYKFANHRGQYLALCQLAGTVSVTRDGTPPYEDVGNFGINIHRGSYSTTSSEGCQTVHPDQWPSFIALASDQANRYFGSAWQRKTIPYVLLAG